MGESVRMGGRVCVFLHMRNSIEVADDGIFLTGISQDMRIYIIGTGGEGGGRGWLGKVFVGMVS